MMTKRLTIPKISSGETTDVKISSFIPGFPVLVFVHGESYSWGSANLHDGRVLAAYAKAVVVAFNYRLGVFGEKGIFQCSYRTCGKMLRPLIMTVPPGLMLHHQKNRESEIRFNLPFYERGKEDFFVEEEQTSK